MRTTNSTTRRACSTTRVIPGTRANIDHIVATSSGAWDTDAEDGTGSVEHRDPGGWRRVDDHMFVNGSRPRPDVGALVVNSYGQIPAATPARRRRMLLE